MGLFKGQFFNNTQQNHIFVCNHPAMTYAGLSSFNLNTARSFIGNKVLTNNIYKSFSRLGMPLGNEIPTSIAGLPLDYGEIFLKLVRELLKLSENDSKSWSSDIFTKGGSAFSQREYSDFSIINLIEWYEEKWMAYDQDKDHSGFVKKNYDEINEIKNSKNGYVEVKRKADQTISAEKGFEEIYLRLYFADKNHLNSSRVVLTKGSPTFVDIPRRPTGKSYSHHETSQKGAGVYVDEEIGDLKKGSDAVAAPLRTSYNSALGMWEVQNQILARLLTDVEPAILTSVDMDPDNIDDIPAEDFYDKGNSKWLGNFTTGLALPLSSENGNPYMFGPNLVQCGDGTKAEKIRVFNRAPRSYTRGTLVICHLMGNEWIIQDFGADVELKPPALGVGTWQFAKFIASTNTHFRPSEGKGSVKNGFTERLPVRPEEWLEFFRHKTYTIGNYNYYSRPDYIDKDWKLNTKIMQSTIYDQTRRGQRFPKINPEGLGNEPDWAEVAPMYWGPVFNGGYAKRVLLLTAAELAERDDENNLIRIKEANSQNMLIPSGTRDLEKSRGKHLAPEIAVNGPWGEFSSPLESYHKMAKEINIILYGSPPAGGSLSFPESSSWEHYGYYLTDPEQEGEPSGINSFSLPPNDPFTVSFISLSCEFAAVDDLLAVSDNVRDSTRAFRSRAIRIYSDRVPLGEGGAQVLGLGNALTRGDPEVGTNDTLSPNQSVYKDINFAKDVKCAPYDCYVKTDWVTGILGPNSNFISTDNDKNENGGELVGIITARTKISRAGGGAITFTTLNNFGMVGVKSATVTDPTFTFLPIGGVGVAFGDFGSFSVNAARPVWGNPEEGPEDFGITALHVQVYDWWPPEDTIYIAPYFTVLHFNPGRRKGITRKKVWFRPKDKKKPSDPNEINYSDPVAGEPTQQIIDDEELMSAWVDQIGTRVDVRVPTYEKVDGNGYSASLPLHTFINSGTQLRPESYWNVATGRRGALLTYGGYVSAVNTIGVYNNATVTDKGEGFAKDKIYISLIKNVGIKVTKTNDKGEILAWEFAEDQNEDIQEAMSDNGLGTTPTARPLLKGEGFLPSDFPIELTFPSDAIGGKSATIKFHTGKVYRRWIFDREPQRYTPAFKGTRISQSCGDGTQYIRGQVKTTSITVDNNESYHPFPGEYEAFFYHHNDITHTFMGGNDLNSVGYLQQIRLTIS